MSTAYEPTGIECCAMSFLELMDLTVGIKLREETMDKGEAHSNEHSRRDWVIFVVHVVKDRPNRNGYQRLVALAAEFNVVVVTSIALPSALDRKVKRVLIANGRKEVWSMALKTAKDLQEEGENIYVHTQYSSIQAIAGFICKLRLGCKWIYDLWDHPSLTYSSRRGPGRWARQLIEVVVRRWVLVKADAWIIAMHPAILGYMPPAPSACKLIFIQPGISTQEQRGADSNERSPERDESVRIVYAGPITGQRLNSLRKWVRDYSGPSVDLEFMGAINQGEGNGVLNAIEQSCVRNSSISFKYHGETSHKKTLKILRRSDIGICPLDTSVLNYRFAFPIKIVEQMHLGLIVVATESHGVRAYIRDGVNGVLISSETDGTRKAFDRAISIAADATKKGEMTKAAIETVQYDTWPLMNKRLIELIKGVVNYL